MCVCVHVTDPDHALTSWPIVMRNHPVLVHLMKTLQKCLKFQEWRGEIMKTFHIHFRCVIHRQISLEIREVCNTHQVMYSLNNLIFTVMLGGTDPAKSCGLWTRLRSLSISRKPQRLSLSKRRWRRCPTPHCSSLWRCRSAEELSLSIFHLLQQTGYGIYNTFFKILLKLQ